MMRKTPKCSLLNQQTPTRHGFHAGNRGPHGSPDNPPHGEVKKILNKENDNAHNSGPPNYLPKTTLNETLTKNYSLSFRFFILTFFSFMFPPSWRSALSVAKDGSCGGGIDTSCPSDLRIIPTRSTVSATSGASGADRWLSG